ncbi:MAG: PEGA domain-containing protein [Bacillota bacterium]|nr:MAG: PEGA domain-containing protein [Bacillota bacterium]
MVGLGLALAVTLATSTAGCPRQPGGQEPAVNPPGGPGTEPAQEYTVAVLSGQPGADVEVDGQRAGMTPLWDLRLGGAARRVTVRSGTAVWEELLPASSSVPHGLFVDNTSGRSPTPTFRTFDVSGPDGAAIYVNGVKVGEAPLTVHVAAENPFTLVAWLPGYLPNRQYVNPAVTTPSHSFSLDVPQDGQLGPGPPVDLALPPLERVTAGHAVIGPVTGANPVVSPEGRLAFVVAEGGMETIVAYGLSSGPGGASGPRALASCRCRDLATGSYGERWSESLGLVGLRRDSLLFLAPGPDPGNEDAPGLIGTGLWEVQAGGETAGHLDLVAWFPTWSLADQVEEAWITADGKAAVVNYRAPGTGWNYVHVIDLATRTRVVHQVSFPYYHPGGCTVSSVSPDGWAVAYLPSCGPIAGELRLLDLRQGQTRVLLDTTGQDLIGWLSWSPDGQFISAACGNGRDDSWVAHGEDASVLFPSHFVVVDGEGNEVADIRVPGHMLLPSLAWSADGSRVGVWTAEVVENQDTPVHEEAWDVRRTGVYAGPLGGTLISLTPEGEDLEPFHWLGFLDDWAVLGGSPGGEAVTLLLSAGGRRVDIRGYTPAGSFTGGTMDYAAIYAERGLVLVPAGPDGGDVAILAPDGTLTPIAAIGSRPWHVLREGRHFVCVTGDSETGEEWVHVIDLDQTGD